MLGVRLRIDQTAPSGLPGGFLFSAAAMTSNDPANPEYGYSYDPTKTEYTTWAKNFEWPLANNIWYGDVVLGSGGSSNRVQSTVPHTLNYVVDINRMYKFWATEGNWEPDYAHAEIDWLDAAGNIVFWHRSESYGSYGSNMAYGTSQDHTGGTYAVRADTYPKASYDITFDADTNQVHFTSNRTTRYLQSFTMSSIDVSSIKSIRINNYLAQSSYTGPTGTAAVSLYLQEVV